MLVSEDDTSEEEGVTEGQLHEGVSFACSSDGKAVGKQVREGS